MLDYHMQSKVHSLFHLVFAVIYVGHNMEMNIISALGNL